MANLWFKNLLGQIPATEKLEKAHNQLVEEYKRIQQVAESEELKKLNELEVYIQSDEYLQKKKEIETITYEGSEEEKLVNELHSLQNNSEIELYLKTLNSEKLKQFQKIEKNDKLARFNEIKETVENGQIDEIRKQMDADHNAEIQKVEQLKELKKHPNEEQLKEIEALEKYLQSEEHTQKLQKTNFQQSDLFKIEQEYNQLKENEELTFYYTFKDSEEYQNYIKIGKSDPLKRLQELKEQTTTDEFLQKVEYLKDSTKFEKTEEFAQLKLYEELKASENICWYFKEKESKKFKPLIEWELVFEENFNENQINNEIWESIIFQGLISINDNYTINGEKQCYTKGENLRINQSVLSIETRHEQAKGKAWNTKQGFVDQNFNCTSGTINTAKAFRFNQGRIEAKINVQQSNKITHGFSLKGEKITPHIDLMKTGKGNGFEVRYIPKDNANAIITHKVKGININNKYYIYKLNWTDKELIWSINNIEVARETHNLSDEQLYINLASIVEKIPESLPATYSLDWIRVYKKREE